jgi:hypothetical protein
MQVIGFNFTKLHAEKSPNFQTKGRNYNIEYTDFDKEKIDLLKDSEALNLSFKYTLTYGDTDENDKSKVIEKQGEISFEGKLKISASKEEAEDFQKAWKKKQIPQSATLGINNFILRRCSIKSVILHDEIGLPDPHLNIPQLQTQPKDSQSS